MSLKANDPDQYLTDTIDYTEQATGQGGRWTDARSMREEFGIAPYDREAFEYPNVVPNALEHTWDAGRNQDAGGTDFLATGKPGCGKSTFGLSWSVRLLEVNEEKVVWRGSTSRSEWLPLAPWTTVLVPKGVDVSAELVPKNPRHDALEVDLKDMVREVKRYEDPVQVNRQLLEPGQFHVLYPDPRMKGCQWVYEEAPERTYEAPGDDRGLFDREDPLNHWWFAYVLARVEKGPNDFQSLILDEIGDIAPEAARSDQFATYQKVELLRDTFVDARKYGLSLFAFGHSERDIHNLIRHKIRWRISMPGSANPTSKNDVIGMDSVPMDNDMASRYDIGECLPFTEQNFERKVRWDDIPAPHDRTLSVDLEVRG
ncbi:ATP-binding protein [Haloplanus salinarum]|uniref:ATP-binding protein n=1 Tax=Haloplanus salinarum TaxID=1912324 RepID=UPI00214AD91E|nr:ATP-binding protein [Haloplanus salinarum]